ncbi:MAG: hypothetical protein Q7S50_02710 [bacterium]|nr:hypothetical protein [bacterium]
MIKRVLIVSVIIFLIGLIAFWLISGGWGAVGRVGQTLMNPFDFFFGQRPSGTFLRLPWQKDSPVRGPDISDYATEANRLNQNAQEEDRAAIEAQYGPDIAQVRTLGNPSPYVGKARIVGTAPTESDSAYEYIEIVAASSNSAPISLTNWSLQSAVSGLRAPIPLGAPLFTIGVINSVQGISLEPGASAVVTTSASPVGTSFRENICSGYLGELQTFRPEMGSSCPPPSEALPMTAENIRTYGDACFDYLNALPQCHFPTTLPSNLSSTCRSFIANTMSYNGCVNRYRNSASFALPSWRVYLALRSEIWQNTHDVIRLLDGEGRTVDVLTY